MNNFPGINKDFFKINLNLNYKDFCDKSILQYNNTKLLIIKTNYKVKKSKIMLNILKKLKVKNKEYYLIKVNK